MRRLASSLAIALMVWFTPPGLATLHAADERPAPAPATPSAQPSVTTSPTPTTRLYVKTVPPGAEVTLDGKPLGPSDGLFIVPPGTSSVKVEFAGQEPRVQEVEIAAGRITRLEIDFAEQPPAIRPTPGNARVDAPASPPVLLPNPLVLPPHASRDAASRVVHILPLADAVVADVPVTAEMTLAVDIDGALVRPLPADLVFDGVPLREVVRRLGEAAEIEISIDESRLRAAGIDPASPITARPGGVPLGSALSAIVRTWQLRWLAEIDRVVITTSGADQGPTQRVYIVADLIDPNDPAGIGLFRFLSEASWPVEQSSVTPYRPLTIGRTAFAEPPPEAKHATLFLVRAEWWRQFRLTRLVALLRQLRKTPVAERVPLSADGYWSDSRSAAAARAALDRPLESEVAINGVPLGDAIEMLSEAAGVPIAIDSVAFAGSPRMQRPVVVRTPTKGQTLAAVLEGMLGNGLGYEVARDQLTVTSASVSAAAYYPVDDLLAAGHTFDSLRSRIGTQGGPVWVIDGGVNCLAITRNTAGHRRVEKILRSLRGSVKQDGPKEAVQAEKPEPTTAGGARQHEAVAKLRVLQPEKDDYEAYRKTHAQLIKSPFVFQKALRQPGIAELPTLAGEKDPVGWLARHVEATAPRDAEIIEVRLSGENADDVTRIVDAITTAYLTEVVQKERHNRIERRKGLEKARSGAAEKLLAAREALSKVTAEGDREQLQAEITMMEQAKKLLDARLDHSAKGIAEIPDRVELLEKARVSSDANP